MSQDGSDVFITEDGEEIPAEVVKEVANGLLRVGIEIFVEEYVKAVQERLQENMDYLEKIEALMNKED